MLNNSPSLSIFVVFSYDSSSKLSGPGHYKMQLNNIVRRLMVGGEDETLSCKGRWEKPTGKPMTFSTPAVVYVQVASFVSCYLSIPAVDMFCDI